VLQRRHFHLLNKAAKQASPKQGERILLSCSFR
jgi:hypothetical protein